MQQWLNELSQFLSEPFFTMVGDTNQVPLLAAFILGLIGAVAPCQLTGNIGAITFYGTKTLNQNNRWVDVLFFLLGKIAVFSLLGLLVWLIGQEFQLLLPEYLSLFRKLLGPLFILVGLILLGILKIPFLERITAPLSNINHSGKWGSFLMGVSFSLAFCPTMFSLFFFTLMPIVVSSSYGAILPSVFAIGTTIPVIIVLALIYLFGLDGSFIKKGRKIGSMIQKSAGFFLILLGLFDALAYWR
ncbi:sulfite exporter TauE/SafE family protein [Bacillus sp. 31A1R]|uniref:Sulfite exporter TauE/SafE family protein n=1 Tax=Robertmurraya mangrovi TaxID=3098077 RepID=A0ABU5J579_9BACI|nr:sulfite exporter TauE/SafE family protein [Bacillus sp. 31A1R]MDZ5474505.1 sulfite exporter TauE/SafE family protein [Bacillus sp. 31A1R]